MRAVTGLGVALGALGLLGVVRPADAQLPGPPPDVVGREPPPSLHPRVEWGPPPDQPRNAVAVGLGNVVGIIGVRYQRFLAPGPLVAWVGVGAYGGGVGFELSLPRLLLIERARAPIRELEGYISLGLTQGWLGDVPHTGSAVAELGLRSWYGGRTMFFDFGIGGSHGVWGTPLARTQLAGRALIALAF
jgi:hypothetical protein